MEAAAVPTVCRVLGTIAIIWGHVLSQAGELVETMLLCSKGCKSIRAKNKGGREGSAGALVLRHFAKGKERGFLVLSS